MTTASLRRYVNLGLVQGQTSRVGNRIHVSSDLVVTSPRVRRRLATPVPAGQPSAPLGRSALVTRETAETNVTVEVNLDGQGHYQVQSGDAMLDHLLAQIARHGLLDLRVSAQGDGLPDNHHLAEDVAIVLGRALRQAIGEGRGIRRMGSAIVPLDEALVQVAVDVGGRGYAVVDAKLDGARVGSLGGEMVAHFLERFALEGGINLHVQVLRGSDPHHKAEAIFKAVARALRAAVEQDPRAAGAVPSTKGTVSA
ncbi:MAG: imidazoleglycerol-phosphate dehydratase HisB [Chloroflexi bacterium]|nr:imidazoleglycerol-phosphate dehydratase HisB [Chloroflexota bacterium]